MSKFDNKKTMPRYYFIAVMMTLVAVVVVAKSTYIMSVKRTYWMQVASRVKKDSVAVPAVRGNILSCNGTVLASSLPEYKLFVDFKTIHDAGTDSLWRIKVDSISAGLSAMFPERTPAQYKRYLEEGRSQQSRRWAIYDGRVDYNTYCEVKSLPVFRLRGYTGGFYCEKFDSRQHPFGANRTVGDLYPGKDEAKNGLEKFYDALLRGKNGIIHRRKVLNKYLNITDTPPTDGADIVTTIDVNMQDLAERALLAELKKKEVNGNVGVAIVMEVKTGDIKAIVNLEKCADGSYAERKNHAVADLMEPGSVFKTVSLMTALQDGMCDTSRVVETGDGVFDMHGRPMKDHNWSRGGYGTITMGRALEVSSNIGVSRIIEDYYGRHPEKFVEGVYRSGITADLKLPLPGYSPAIVRMPRKNSRGQWVNWSKTSLAWMSIGYETQVPPISTLAFYNAIANDGCMMYPRFVKSVVKNGEVLDEFPPEVVPGKEHICSLPVVRKVQAMLEHVVSRGTGKKAGSTSFKIAGKTGTAQVSQGKGGYKSGTTRYLLSFAGYFPADAPRYSCIVCIQKTGLPASGTMSAKVFHEIAEGIMAQSLKMDVTDARDSASRPIPDVKFGNICSAGYVLNRLGIHNNASWSGSYATGNPIWGTAECRRNSVQLTKATPGGARQVPNVVGMGARDAVYLLESRGIRVQIVGRGKVARQSLVPGTPARRGQRCQLTLD